MPSRPVFRMEFNSLNNFEMNIHVKFNQNRMPNDRRRTTNEDQSQ